VCMCVLKKMGSEHSWRRRELTTLISCIMASPNLTLTVSLRLRTGRIRGLYPSLSNKELTSWTSSSLPSPRHRHTHTTSDNINMSLCDREIARPCRCAEAWRTQYLIRNTHSWSAWKTPSLHRLTIIHLPPKDPAFDRQQVCRSYWWLIR